MLKALSTRPGQRPKIVKPFCPRFFTMVPLVGNAARIAAMIAGSSVSYTDNIAECRSGDDADASTAGAPCVDFLLCRLPARVFLAPFLDVGMLEPSRNPQGAISKLDQSGPGDAERAGHDRPHLNRTREAVEVMRIRIRGPPCGCAGRLLFVFTAAPRRRFQRPRLPTLSRGHLSKPLGPAFPDRTEA
jgi:hypothetical protein